MTTQTAASHFRDEQTVIAYTAPIVVFGILTTLESYLPATAYPAAYAIKVVLVTATLLWFRGPLRDIRPSLSVVPVSVLVGLVVVASWIVIDTRLPYPHLGSRVGFDPYAAMSAATARTAFLLIRFVGLVLVVPVMEELFWRSFLLRYATQHDFLTLPFGGFSARAFWIMVAISAGTHPEWLVAAIASALFALIVRQTNNVFAAVLAHAVANLCLGLYILRSGQWQYW